MEFGTGFFSLADWKAPFWTCKGVNGDLLHPEPIHLRKAFSACRNKTVTAAWLYIASTTGVYASIPGQFQTLTDKINQYHPTVNGHPVTEERQNPGQVSPHHWCAYYRAYDIRRFLQKGENVLGIVTVAMAISACLYLEYDDGTEQFVGCEDMQMNGRGPWRLWIDGVEEHGGKCETYVSAFAFDGWDQPGYDAALWMPAIPTDVVTYLREQRTVVIPRKHLSPIDAVIRDEDRYIFDFGENLHGNVTVRIHGVRRGTWGGWLSDGATSAYEYMHMDARGSGTYWYSLNHPFLMGSLHSWFYRTLCGITPIEPGYRRFAVNPWLGDIQSANAAVETAYGVIRVSAESDKNLTVDVPVGCHAVVTWNGGTYTVAAGHHVFD